MSTILAIYEGGVFRPQSKVDLPDGQIVEVIPYADGTKEMKPWMRFAGCLTDEDAREIMSAVHEAFEKVNPDDWS